MPETSWLLFALMKANLLSSDSATSAITSIVLLMLGAELLQPYGFYFSVCYWANSAEVCGSKAALLIPAAGRGIIYAPPSLCCLTVLCF